MKRIHSYIVVSMLTLLLVLSVTPAKAAEAGPFYVGIFGGYVMPDDLELEDDTGVSLDISLDNSWMFGIKGGYIFPAAKWFAMELEFAYLGEQDVDMPGLTDGNFQANNLMFNLIARYPDGWIHPYLGVGLGWSWGEFKASVPGATLDESDNAFAWQILAGVTFEITPNWSADVGYRYFSAQYEFADAAGTIDATAKNSIFLIGFNYHF